MILSARLDIETLLCYHIMAIHNKEDIHMYAVIETGGKQLKVTPGERVRVENIGVKGEMVSIKEVLMVSKENAEVIIGAPYVKDAVVDGKVVRQAKGKKVTVMHYKPKKRIRKKNGHRQEYTLLEIDEIRIGGDILGKKPEHVVTKKLPVEKEPVEAAKAAPAKPKKEKKTTEAKAPEKKTAEKPKGKKKA
jgi:large subunit ribosomal protein L21